MKWQEVEIIPSEDPLQVAGGDKIFSTPVYLLQGYDNALQDIWMRQDAVRRLRWAASLLPSNIGLLLWDGWRSLQLQGELWDKYRSEIADKSGLSGDQLDKETRRFVSPPEPRPPAPHSTGGTIDLTLCDLSGEPLDMGGEFDQLDDCSRTDFYFHAEGEETEYHKRRRLLLAVMTHAGFSNYPEEWWHFDLGNQWHHSRVGGAARYGFVGDLPERTL